MSSYYMYIGKGAALVGGWPAAGLVTVDDLAKLATGNTMKPNGDELPILSRGCDGAGALDGYLVVPMARHNGEPKKRTSLFQVNFPIAVRKAGHNVDTFHQALAAREPIKPETVRAWYNGMVAYPEEKYRPHIAELLGLADFNDLVAREMSDGTWFRISPNPGPTEKERRMELVLGGLHASLGATDDEVLAAVQHALSTPEDRIYMRVAVMLVNQAMKSA